MHPSLYNTCTSPGDNAYILRAEGDLSNSSDLLSFHQMLNASLDYKVLRTPSL